MNILFYTDTPNVGGAEKHMLLLAKYLHQMGHEVSLAYGAYSKVKELHEDFSSVCKAVYPLPVIHKHDPRHFQAIRKILQEGHYDLIHLHLWNPGACRFAFFAADFLKVPIIATEHDPFELSGIKGMIKRNCLNKTRQIIVISQANHRLLGDFYQVPKERLNLVQNGVELRRFLDNHDKASLPVHDGDIRITCIAEFHERKGIRFLIDAFKTLQLSIPKLQLILVGDGPIRKKLEEKYKDTPNLHFLGWRNDVPQILQSSDIFVLPSLNEAFGQVLLEAMASGVICIGTNNGGIPDIIQDGKTGFLVPPGNSEKIAEAIQTIIRNPDQKKDIEATAKKWVQEKFTADKMARETLEVYKHLGQSNLERA